MFESGQCVATPFIAAVHVKHFAYGVIGTVRSVNVIGMVGSVNGGIEFRFNLMHCYHASMYDRSLCAGHNAVW